MKLTYFKELDFLQAIKGVFKELKVPMNYVADEPTSAKEILKDTYKDNSTFTLVDDVYFVGMIDDAAFDQNESLAVDKIKSDYDGILIFGITLNRRENGLLPTRSQLAEISRAFNREFYYTPVVIVFKYKDENKEYIAFANTERLKYKQSWREGEKAGKVSLLRDINIDKPHRGHEDIINQLKISTSGKNKVDSFAKLYDYWQEVFNVSILNKKFYQELSNWFFWARDEVRFPNSPLRIDHDSNEKFEEAQAEHNGKNVIRLLTRILFVWFIKEKGLIPEKIFDEKFITEKLINDFEPQKLHGAFATGKQNSRYYRAILQNLFFATLNCEKGKRQFRRDGNHQNTSNLMRYKTYFKDPETFLKLMEDSVPFMNGGLFDCLDKPHSKRKGKKGGDIIIYRDGFSDKENNLLSVPDYLFFDINEEVDLSKAYGKATYRKTTTRGLLKILESYKFTITENTPIEEDIALDPELLGRVFENLLASYNPETKTTARKQTGSFYTPREVVNYMVDESLVAYLKNSIDTKTWNLTDAAIDDSLAQLVSYDKKTLFNDRPSIKKDIIYAIDNCKIFDPACGSGAFPMGTLQKMVHILHKIDPNNEEWKQRQLDKIDIAISSLSEIGDSEYREKSIKELSDQKKDIRRAFRNNELDYGRKLYLIENCIYGVDIQAIAVQISKLRFFISLIVDQNVENDKENFGIRPLPNLETKFVAANTLIGITKELSLFDNPKIKEQENLIKILNKKLFSIKTPFRKRELRKEIKTIRNKMAFLLEDSLDNLSAKQLAEWNPFDQNASSLFFDPEWMFDIKEGFDIVIANPPYIGHKGGAKETFREIKNTTLGKLFNNERMDIFYYFFHLAINMTNDRGVISFITTNYYPTADSATKLREDINKRTFPFIFVDFNELTLFESAKGQHNLLTFLSKTKVSNQIKVINIDSKDSKSEKELEGLLGGEKEETTISYLDHSEYRDKDSGYLLIKGLSKKYLQVKPILYDVSKKSNNTVKDFFNVSQGIVTGIDKISPKHVKKIGEYANKLDEGVYVVSKEFYDTLNADERKLLKPWFKNSDIKSFSVNEVIDKYVINIYSGVKIKNYPKIEDHLLKFKEAIISRNYDSGELSKAKNLGAWWALSSSRKEFDFSAPKIVSPQRSYSNTFGYTEMEWCASADVYFITDKKNSEFSLESLIVILNSRLIYLWLYYRGKRKGDMLELYLTPVEAIPLPKLSKAEQLTIKLLGRIIIYLAKDSRMEMSLFKVIAESILLQNYFYDHMQEKKIDVLQFVESDIKAVMRDRYFEKLSDSEKEEVIEKLHQIWNDPDNEVVKRMAMFKEKSPDILKPILES